MKRHNRKVIQGILNHSYQRTINGYLLFYTVIDYLVLFTAFCQAATRFNIRILTLCLMPDHVHHSSIAERRKDLSAFAQLYTSEYAKSFNLFCGTRGSLFRSPFGSVPKVGDKNARSNFIYVYNNPAERRLVKMAEEYRWNFLAYARSTHPFSDPIKLSQASCHLRRCIKLVDAQHKDGLYLNHSILNRMFNKLDKRETEQLTDYIISTYSVIDHEAAIRFFGDYERMLTAVHSTTGKEYDLNEIFVGKSDECYEKMTGLLLDAFHFKDIHIIIGLDSEKKYELYTYLLGKTSATPEQVAKFLHLRLHRDGK